MYYSEIIFVHVLSLVQLLAAMAIHCTDYSVIILKSVTIVYMKQEHSHYYGHDGRIAYNKLAYNSSNNILYYGYVRCMGIYPECGIMVFVRGKLEGIPLYHMKGTTHTP